LFFLQSLKVVIFQLNSIKLGLEFFNKTDTAFNIFREGFVKFLNQSLLVKV